jgi:hypothetical protein
MNADLEKLFSNFYSIGHVRPSSNYVLQTRSEQIINFLKLFEIKSLFDAGCRNRDWISQIDFNFLNIEYYGGEISKDMVIYCNEHYPEYSIVHHDCTTDLLPEVDCILSSEVLIHLSNSNKLKFLKNFIRSQSKFLLMTTDSTCGYNEEISLTGPHNDFPFAPVNWKLNPWHFPDPIHTIPSQNLNLWSRDQLKNIIDNL